MILKCTSFNQFKMEIENRNSNIVMFGAGAIGQVIMPQILSDLGLLSYVDCYIDNDKTKWGACVNVGNNLYMVKSVEYLKSCNASTVILVNASRYSDIVKQLKGMSCTSEMECYIMPMMLIHNYCSSVSSGSVVMDEKPLIPRKLHYMWLGRKPLPDNLKKCIDSWCKYCPDYEIIEWNEDNYDITKHPYMAEAYKCGAFGFVPDYARLDILYNQGGFYLDTDVELKKNLDPLQHQGAFCGVEKWQVINFGGLSGSVIGHPMIKKFLDARKEVWFTNSDGSKNMNTCGFYDTQVAIREGYKLDGTTQSVGGMNIYEYDYFHPYDYMSGIINETDNTYSVHWFNGGWLDDNKRKENERAKKQYMELYERAKNNYCSVG